MSMEQQQLKLVVEGILMTVGKPLPIKKIIELFAKEQRPAASSIEAALLQLKEDYQDRSFELVEVASGFRIQVKQTFSPWVGKLLEEKPAKYSRALLETIALIAYRQPITRADIEDIRGVSVSSAMVKTLQERDWVRVVGHKDVPGKPALYATTKAFLDYFNLKSLEDLPSLAEIKNLEQQHLQTELLLEEALDINAMVMQAAENLAESVQFIVATSPELQVAIAEPITPAPIPEHEIIQEDDVEENYLS